MKREKDRYLPSLASGYGLMGLQVILTLIQIPLALKFLGQEGFGLWTLAAQVALWLQAMDLGMNGAVARYLIDFKADPTKDNLSKCIGSALRIFTAQGFLVFLAASAIALSSAGLFGLNKDNSEMLRNTLFLLGISVFIRFTFKVASAWLYASRRMDLSGYAGIAILIVEFSLFLLLLLQGCGIYAFAWSKVISALIAGIIYFWMATRLAELPVHMIWGKFDPPMFKKLARFGTGMFTLTLGTQLLTISQTILVSKQLGLASAAVWATAPKLYNLASQAISRLWDLKIPYLTSIMASRREQSLLTQFKSIFITIAYISGGVIGTLIAMNPEFITVWTDGRIKWSHTNDVLIGIAFYLALLIRCFTDFVLHTKLIGWMPILMLIEGILFVVVASIMLPYHGIKGMLCASLFIGGILRLPYAIAKFRAYLNSSWKAMMPFGKHLLGGACTGAFILIALKSTEMLVPDKNPLPSLITKGIIAGPVMIAITWKMLIVPHRARTHAAVQH